MTNNPKNKTLTAEAIQKRLGFSTIALPAAEPFGARRIAAIRAAGITRIEICGLLGQWHYDHRDATQIAEITSECRKQGITIASVHGPCLQYAWPHDEFRKAAAKEAAAAARVAAEMGATVFVDHFSVDEQGETTIREMLDLLKDTDITLAIENLPRHPEPHHCRAIVDRVDSDRFGIALDIGHPYDGDGINYFTKPGGAQEIVSIFKDRLVHVHLHDFIESDHYPPFAENGKIRWNETIQALQNIGYTGELMFEAVAPISIEDTLEKTANFPKNFIAKYGE